MSAQQLGASLQHKSGLVVLTHKESRDGLQHVCGAQCLVLGIREAKGLEFPQVAIVDFFSGLDREHQLRWKDMLLLQEEEGGGEGKG